MIYGDRYLMKLEFKLLSGQEIKHEIKKTNFVIGRSPHSDIVVPFEGFSRKHCQVELTDEGEILLTDLDSANGILIDGKRIPVNEKTRYNLLLPLVIGPAEVSIEIEVPTAQQFQNIGSFTQKVHDHIPSSSDVQLSTKAPTKISKTSTSSLKKKIDLKSVGAIILVVIGFFLYQEIKNLISDDSSEENELSKLQFEKQLQNRGKDGSVKTTNF